LSILFAACSLCSLDKRGQYPADPPQILGGQVLAGYTIDSLRE
jgi:hypothetical protein